MYFNNQKLLKHQSQARSLKKFGIGKLWYHLIEKIVFKNQKEKDLLKILLKLKNKTG